MAIILKNGSVFLHIPKTGGRWVGGVLYESGLVDYRLKPRHLDVPHYLQANHTQKSLWRKFQDRLPGSKNKTPPVIFTFVRNPFKWYESWFKFMSRDDQQWRHWGGPNSKFEWHPVAALNGLGDTCFNQFVENVHQQQPGFVSHMYEQYTKTPISFIGKQEQLAEDLTAALSLSGIKLNPERLKSKPKFGVSWPQGPALEWDQALKKKIALDEYEGFTRYGYQQSLIDLGIDTSQTTT